MLLFIHSYYTRTLLCNKLNTLHSLQKKTYFGLGTDNECED